MAYTKPQVVAQNGVAGSFAAGCNGNSRPTGNNSSYNIAKCKACEITM